MKTIEADEPNVPYTRDTEKPSLPHELVRYNVERIFTNYIQYVRGELQLIKDKTKSNEKVINATNELDFLTQER